MTPGNIDASSFESEIHDNEETVENVSNNMAGSEPVQGDGIEETEDIQITPTVGHLHDR